MTDKEYDKLVKERAPKSPVLKDCMNAFLIGGLICCIGEVLRTVYMNAGANSDDAKAYVCLTLIAITALLTSIGVFDKIAKVAGAGTIVPITGFANAVVSPAMEFKTEGFIMGVGNSIFKIAGPVILYGTAASVAYGLIIYVFKLY